MKYVQALLSQQVGTVATTHFVGMLRELRRLTRIEKAVKKYKYIYNIQDISVYTNVSANYMFRPLLVKPSSGWIP